MKKNVVLGCLTVAVIMFSFGCQPKDGGDCRYEEASFKGVITKVYEGGVWLQLEPDNRLLILENEYVEGEARKGDFYMVRVNEIVEGSCTPTIALEAKRL